jgi:hypothetical protein
MAYPRRRGPATTKVPARKIEWQPGAVPIKSTIAKPVKRQKRARPRVIPSINYVAPVHKPVQLPSYSRPHHIDEKKLDALVIGSLYFSNVHLIPALREAYPHPPLRQTYVSIYSTFRPGEQPFPPGTMMIYAGTCECKEKSIQDRIMTVQRHRFIVGSGMYIIIDPIGCVQL